MATFKIDPKFLTEMLKTLDKGSYITIGCNGDDPLLIETDGGEFTYVVLPMHDGEKTLSPNHAWDENGTDITALLKEQKAQEYEEWKANKEKEWAEQGRQRGGDGDQWGREGRYSKIGKSDERESATSARMFCITWRQQMSSILIQG